MKTLAVLLIAAGLRHAGAATAAQAGGVDDAATYAATVQLEGI